MSQAHENISPQHPKNVKDAEKAAAIAVALYLEEMSRSSKAAFPTWFRASLEFAFSSRKLNSSPHERLTGGASFGWVEKSRIDGVNRWKF